MSGVTEPKVRVLHDAWRTVIVTCPRCGLDHESTVAELNSTVLGDLVLICQACEHVMSIPRGSWR